MEKNIASTGQAMAETMYRMLFAPMAKSLGQIGDLVVQSAAKSCSQDTSDPLSAQFAQLVAREAKK